MAYCPNCNEEISITARFCSKCGVALADKEAEQNLNSNVELTESTPSHTHVFEKANCTSPELCSCGVTNGSALGHDYQSGSCLRCGAVDENYVSNTLVYQDSRVKIYYKQITAKGVVFEVENLTAVTITIQADVIAINHISTDDIIMSDEVAPYSIGEVVAKCRIPVTDNVGIISGQLRVIDFNKSFQTYDASFVNVEVNPNVIVSMPTTPNTLLYSDSRVKVFFKELTSSGVVFTVENLTDVTITIQADALSINGRSTDDIVMSDEVAPYSVGDVVAKCSFSGISSVETVGGTLRIIDFNKSFKTYDATFINVEV